MDDGADERAGARIHGEISDLTGRYPIWAWYSPKPDLRQSGHLPPGEHGVRIEFAAPEERVLLSRFDAWGMAVLNRWYLPLDEEEYEAWDNLSGSKLYTDLSPDLRQKVHAKWSRIFDLERLRRSEMWGEDLRVQAVLEEIRLEEVVKVKEFRSR